MTEEEKNFNQWFDEYNIEQIKVFEEPDLKMAYLQGCADEVEKWIDVNGKLRTENAELKEKINACKFTMIMSGKVEKQLREQLTEAKEIIKLLLGDLRNRSYNPVKDVERAENFIDGIEI